MNKGIAVSKHVRSLVLGAFQVGEKQATIARRFSQISSTVSRILSDFNGGRHFDIMRRSNKTTVHTYRFIKRISQNDPWKSRRRLIEAPICNKKKLNFS